MNALFVALVAICVAFFYFNLYPTELKLNRDSSLHTCSAQNQGIAPGYPPDTSPLDYSLLEIFFQKNSKETLKWGTYRSGLYYGLRSRTYPYFVSAGLLWQSQHEDLSQMRHLCRQEDRLQKYGWLKHDGKTFGMQIIEDQHNRLQLKTFYTRFLPKENEQINGWGTRIQVTHLEPIKKNERFQRIQVSKTKLSLFFYIDLGCEDDSLEHTCRDILKDLIEPVTNDPIECSQEKSTSKDTSFTCQQMEFISHGAATSNSSTNPQLSIFEFHTIFQLRTKKKNDMIQSELRFTGLKNVNLLNVREKLIQLGTIDPLAEDQFTKEIYLDNMIEDGSTMIIVQAIIEVNDLKQFQIEEDVQLDILFHENSKISPSSVALFSSNINQFFTKKIEKESKHFDTKFDQVFQLSTLSSLSVSSRQIFNKSQILFAQAAFSNLMGGIGFFYGSSLVHFSMNPPLFQEKNQVIEIAPKPLFTAVPSRSFFPRGFLWDEGFHQMGIYPFDLEITQDVIVHWMRVMLQDGYIPREQILGNLARSRVPKEFLVQHETHANPPSLILCIEKILRTNNKDKIVPFLKLVFPFLKRWYQWLIMTQRGPSEMPGTFRWRGRSLDDGKLIANTLSSGLDDYPRASVPSEKEIHVDLVAWMIKLSDVLAKISVILDPKDPLKQVYLENKERFLQALEKYHWHEEAQTYYDYGLHSEDGRIESQVVVRCRNEAGQM
jgi:mannosyl-oligosaccharide glucosidase